MEDTPRKSGHGDESPDTTQDLLAQARNGNEAALNEVVTRYWPILRRWAHGRLPDRARGMADTEDLVQRTMMSVIRRIDSFEPNHSGAFFGFLTVALRRQVIDIIRMVDARPGGDELPLDLVDAGSSPLDVAIDGQKWAAYDAALRKLSKRKQKAVLLRVELGLPYAEIAKVLGSPSENAARMTVTRAIRELAELIDA